ncbi:MAG: LamG-like jellyroll fold domain-containing protein [Verrucomicrobiota bacterium]
MSDFSSYILSAAADKTRALATGVGSVATGGTLPVYTVGDQIEQDFYFLDSAGAYTSWSGDVTNVDFKFAIGNFSSPTSGTFIFTVDSNSTSAISSEISAADFEAALNALDYISSAGGVDVLGPPGGPFKITYRSNGLRDLPTIETKDLTPASSAIALRAKTGDSDTQEIQVVALRQDVAIYNDSWTAIVDADTSSDTYNQNIGFRGTIDANTANAFIALQGEEEIALTAEIKVVRNGQTKTLLQAAVKLKSNIINENTLNPVGFPTFLTLAAGDTRYVNLLDLPEVPQGRAAVSSITAGGPNSYLSIANHSELDFDLNDFSVVYWARINSASVDSDQVIVSKIGGGTGFSIYYERSSGTYGRLGIYLAGGFYFVSSSSFADDRWHCFAANFDRTGNLSVYVDGALLGAVDISPRSGISISTSTGLDIIGAGGANSLVSGAAGNYIAIYDRLLTTSEIDSIAQDPNRAPSYTDLVVGLNLSGAYQGLFPDRSSNNFSAAVTGSIIYNDSRPAQPSGSGDLIAANNLSDLGSVATAFSNIKQAATSSSSGVVILGTDPTDVPTTADADLRYQAINRYFITAFNTVYLANEEYVDSTTGSVAGSSNYKQVALTLSSGNTGTGTQEFSAVNWLTGKGADRINFSQQWRVGWRAVFSGFGNADSASRIRLKFGQFPTGAADLASADHAAAAIIYPDGNIYLQVADGSTLTTSASLGTVSLSPSLIWVDVFLKGAGDGTAELWVDGSLAGTLSDMSTRTFATGRIRFELECSVAPTSNVALNVYRTVLYTKPY